MRGAAAVWMNVVAGQRASTRDQEAGSRADDLAGGSSQSPLTPRVSPLKSQLRDRTHAKDGPTDTQRQTHQAQDSGHTDSGHAHLHGLHVQSTQTRLA